MLRQRRPDERQPDGQQLELGRRFVAFTRAMRRLWICVQALDLAEDPWTRKLQGKAQDERVNFWNLHETWSDLGLHFPEVDTSQLWRLWQTPTRNDLQTCMSKLRMSKPRASSFETSQPAASWFQSPAHWDNVWGQLQWQPAARQLPDLGAFDQANKRARYGEENQDVGYFVPFIPVMQNLSWCP